MHGRKAVDDVDGRCTRTYGGVAVRHVIDELAVARAAVEKEDHAPTLWTEDAAGDGVAGTAVNR